MKFLPLRSIISIIVLSMLIVPAHAADKGFPDMNINKVRELAKPDNMRSLIDLLNSGQQLSQWTRDTLLEKVFDQGNYKAVIPLLNVGARPTRRMLDQLLDILEPNQRGAGPEDQESRIEYYMKIKVALDRSLKK